MEQAYRTAFPRDPILDGLERIAKDPAFIDLGVIRNFLTHRAVPARALGASMGPSAKPDMTTIPRLNIQVECPHHVLATIAGGKAFTFGARGYAKIR